MPVKILTQISVIATPKRQLLAQKHVIRRIYWSTRFLHSSPFYSAPKSYTLQCPAPKVLSFTMLFNWPNTLKSALPVEAFMYYIPCNTCSWTYLTQHSKLHLDRFSRFCTAHGRESLYFTVCVKT